LNRLHFRRKIAHHVVPDELLPARVIRRCPDTAVWTGWCEARQRVFGAHAGRRNEMLQVGDKAPDFSLPDSDMEIRNLSDFNGRKVVLYFYPKDDTPGCTIQATEFTDLLDDFEGAGAQVMGISRDDCFSHQAFRDKYGLKIILLADVEGDACASYGVWQEKEKNGVKKMGVVRSTFVIDQGGVVRYAQYDVSPKDHADHMLELVRDLG
jgi:peroxiredoxin Q/BCP